jgi:putative SOS response-associated peptidase YedK
MINARSETAATLPAFRDCLKLRRCLIPADGFYEWKKASNDKQPFCFAITDDSVFAFAGLWDRWRGADGMPIETCSILTTTPNALTADVHDRMPVILRRDDYDLWLDPAFKDESSLYALLKPFDAGMMKKFPVSTRMNSVKNDDPQCGEPMEVAEQAGLF